MTAPRISLAEIEAQSMACGPIPEDSAALALIAALREAREALSVSPRIVTTEAGDGVDSLPRLRALRALDARIDFGEET